MLNLYEFYLSFVLYVYFYSFKVYCFVYVMWVILILYRCVLEVDDFYREFLIREICNFK